MSDNTRTQNKDGEGKKCVFFFPFCALYQSEKCDVRRRLGGGEGEGGRGVPPTYMILYKENFMF